MMLNDTVEPTNQPFACCVHHASQVPLDLQKGSVLTQAKPLVLIVDDNPTNLDILAVTLKNHYRLAVAKSGPKALQYAAELRPDLVLLDIMMPEMNGFEVCAKLKQDQQTQTIPVIFITALDDTKFKTKGFELGGVDYITKPFHAAEVLARVRTHVSIIQMQEALQNSNLDLAQRVQEQTAELDHMFQQTIHAMALTVETRDPYTAGHQRRVAQLACAIGNKLGFSPEQIKAIGIAGQLHDIGKIRVPEGILNRPGELLPVEWEMIKVHSQIGYDILQNIPFPWPIAQIILQHHEHLDGSGYPQGLRAEAILPETKVLTVADSTEAKSSFRPYRPALGIDVALEDNRRHRGTYFDPDAIDACEELFRQDGFNFEQDVPEQER